MLSENIVFLIFSRDILIAFLLLKIPIRMAALLSEPDFVNMTDIYSSKLALPKQFNFLTLEL